jgi:hypothetical protein
MTDKIKRLLLWILKRMGITVYVIPDEVMRIIPQAKLECYVFSVVAQSGEYKRHQVLSRLIKAGAKESDAALAIELHLRGIK